mgnify:CR=1 FL=1
MSFYFVNLSAIKKEYPISSYEIEQLVRELDNETSRRYEKRPLNKPFS